jgi:hypothetical protein
MFLFVSCHEDLSEVTKNNSCSEVRKYKTERNGYDKNECVKGFRILSDYYFKLAFKTKKHGLFLTKKAYSVRMEDEFFIVYICPPKDFYNLWVRMIDNFEEEASMFCFNYVYNIFCNCNYYLILTKRNIEKLTKKECDKWIVEHAGSYKEL